MRIIINFILAKVYQLLWLLLHFVYRRQNEIREFIQMNWRYFFQRLASCLPPYSYYGELAKLTKASENLKKLPKHLAISVIETPNKSYEDEPIDLQVLARVISWAWVARIPVVSVYDYHGRIKTSYRELGCYVQEELIQNYWALKKYGRASDPPTIKFHNVPRLNGYTNGLGSNGVVKSSNPLHIVVFSQEDGKPEIIRTAKQIYFNHFHSNKLSTTISDSTNITTNTIKTTTTTTTKEADPFEESDNNDKNDKENNLIQNSLENENSINSKKSSQDYDDSDNIDESKFDLVLNKAYSWPSASTEPDLLVILGNISSTLGFLPWHIRLTEIHWLPKLQIVETNDFLQVLRKFSGCQQRFGT